MSPSVNGSLGVINLCKECQMPYPKTEAVLAYLQKNNWNPLVIDLKAFVKGQEQAIESELALGQHYEGRATSDTLIQIYRAFILIWISNNRPLWNGCSTKDAILEKLLQYYDSQLVKWLQDYNDGLGPAQQPARVAVVPAAQPLGQTRSVAPPNQVIPANASFAPGRPVSPAVTRSQSPAPVRPISPATTRPALPVSSAPHAALKKEVDAPGSFAARTQAIQNALGANQAPVRVKLQQNSPQAPVQTLARRPSHMAPLAVDKKVGKAVTSNKETLALDKKTAEALLQSEAMRAIVVMDANNRSYGATPGAVAICDTYSRMGTDGDHGKFLMSQTLLPEDKDDWIKLGKNTKEWGMGNCQQCMAAAFAELVASNGWSSPIELVHTGQKKSGHHFLVVGRPNRSVAISSTTDWGGAFVADLWLQNLHRPGDGKLKRRPKNSPADATTTYLGMEKGTWVSVVKACASDKFLIDHLNEVVVDLAWTP
jgi:hypothetical protein